MASIGPNGMSTDSSDTRFTVLERTLDQFQVDLCVTWDRDVTFKFQKYYVL